jgi:hypothetical protein
MIMALNARPAGPGIVAIAVVDNGADDPGERAGMMS